MWLFAQIDMSHPEHALSWIYVLLEIVHCHVTGFGQQTISKSLEADLKSTYLTNKIVSLVTTNSLILMKILAYRRRTLKEQSKLSDQHVNRKSWTFYVKRTVRVHRKEMTQPSLLELVTNPGQTSSHRYLRKSNTINLKMAHNQPIVPQYFKNKR